MYLGFVFFTTAVICMYLDLLSTLDVMHLSQIIVNMKIQFQIKLYGLSKIQF